VSIDEEATLTGRVSLAIADLTLSGTVMSGGVGPVGRSRVRLAGGAGGWGKTLRARSYANDAGIKASAVLADAARECGESFDVTTLPGDTRLGGTWVREEAPAARTLEQIVPSGWYVGTDGMTRIGKRTAATLTTPAAISAVDRSRRTVALAAESIAAIVPGIVVEGIEAVDVLHELAPESGLRTTIWGTAGGDASRSLAALRRIVDQLDPDRRFRGIYEYRIVSQEGERLNLQPIRVSLGMPDLPRVPVRPGIPGASATHRVGARVLVGFVDASQARPVVIGFEDAEGDGFAPPILELDADASIVLGAGGVLGAARFSDPVIAGPFAGTITGGSMKTRIA
jgi:hypothetical protein